jgi:hypothetical protein
MHLRSRSQLFGQNGQAGESTDLAILVQRADGPQGVR